jgi:hypothetical protein
MSVGSIASAALHCCRVSESGMTDRSLLSVLNLFLDAAFGLLVRVLTHALEMPRMFVLGMHEVYHQGQS